MENPPLRVFSLPFAAMTLFRFYGYYLSQKAPPSSIEDRGILLKRLNFQAINLTTYETKAKQKIIMSFY
jgi:hypothetical protein